MSDEILTGVMKAVQKQNIKIPDELGVIAISNGFIPKLYYPEITYAETSGYKLGKLAYSCFYGESGWEQLYSTCKRSNTTHEWGLSLIA